MAAPVQLPLTPSSPLEPLRGLPGPIHRIRTAVGDVGWWVTGHAEVRRLLTDNRLGRAHPEPDKAARTGKSALFGGPLGNFDTEWADHARMRGLLQPHFTPKLMRALAPRVDELTTGLLDRLADDSSPADLVKVVAEPLPVLVICELLGVPYEDRDRFQTWARDAADTEDRSRSEQGLAALFGYGTELVARRRTHPGEDVISRLATTPGVSDEEAAGLGMALLFAGHETTVVQIGLGAMHLLAHQEQWQALATDPALLARAVEEVLRAPGRGGGGIPRYARTDLEIAGTLVHAGELVLLDTGAANHDATVFADPDRFDITRSAATHLTFGHGLRYCIGAPLARIELRSVLHHLTTRFPTMRLAIPVSELTVRTGTLTGGLVALPVAW